MPNGIAYLVLAIWPLIMLGFFKALPPGRALIWTFLLSFLFLPPQQANFDLPLLPAFDKVTLPYVTALLCLTFVHGQKLVWLPKTTLGRVLALIYVFSPFLTVLNNPEPLVFVADAIRGLYFWDIFGLVGTQALLLLGFLLARQLLTTKEDLRDLVIAIVILGVVYAFPMLVETRLSPQLNTWVYGFFQHVFSQTIRWDGYRPMVFLEHGIWGAMLMMMCTVCSLIILKLAKRKQIVPLIGVFLFLAMMLVLTKTLAALLYGVTLISLLLIFSPRIQLIVAAVLAALTISYPVVKSVGLVPEATILRVAEKAGDERAYSLQFRFEQESALLERALEKPVTGWGSWGRNHLHDPITGTITTISDGRWIITLGVYGWIGLIAEFGLLSLPIFLLFPRRRRPKFVHARTGYVSDSKFYIQQRVPNILTDERRAQPMVEPEISPYVSGLALVLAVNFIDLLPNATLSPLTWLIAGGLLGYAEAQRAALKQDAEQGGQAPLTQHAERQKRVLL